MKTVKIHGLMRGKMVACLWLAACAMVIPSSLSAMIRPALALSEIQRDELPAPATPAQPDDESDSPAATVPMPDPIQPPSSKQQSDDNKTAPPQDGGITSPHVDPDAPLPQIEYDLAKLPEPVRRLHDLIITACEGGDIEKIRPLIGTGDGATQLSLTEVDGDAIEFLKGLSGDPDGQEILAILEEVLNAGYVHLDAGTPQELYVWPYFFAMPLDKLDARQKVELFKLVTASDYDDMKQFGAYIFYRVGISPQGHWAFFVAGD
jgi:hypothetical protein